MNLEKPQKQRKASDRSDIVLRMTRKSQARINHYFDFQQVKTPNEFYQSAGLVYEEYRRNNYLLPNPNQMKVILQQATTSATTFVAKIKNFNLVVGTITIVQDSPIGLPMESEFKSEIKKQRLKGKKLGEATMFAFNNELLNHPKLGLSRGDRMTLVMNLFRAAYDHMRANKTVEKLVACYNPKHKAQYDMMEFKEFGGLRTYSSVQGAAAVGGVCAIDDQENNPTKVFKEIFGFDRPAVLAPGKEIGLKMSLEEFYYFFKLYSELTQKK